MTIPTLPTEPIAPPPARKSRKARNAILSATSALALVAAAAGGTYLLAPRTVTKHVTVTEPGPTTTLYVPGPTPSVTVTQTVQPQAAMSSDGVYVIGQDIQPGTYHTDGQGSNGQCYYALLSSTNTNDIIDNNITSGPATITVDSGVAAVEISGGCSWEQVG